MVMEQVVSLDTRITLLIILIIGVNKYVNKILDQVDTEHLRASPGAPLEVRGSQEIFWLGQMLSEE